LDECEREIDLIDHIQVDDQKDVIEMIDGNNSAYIEKVISNRRSINEPEKSITRSYHDLTPTESKSKK